MSVFEFGPFRFNEATFELSRNEVVIHTERRVGDVLSYLIRHRERVVSTAELLEKLWDRTHVTRASLARAVLLLRKALDDEARDPRWIQTTHRRGYRFVGTVTVHGVEREQVAGDPDPIVGRAPEIALLDDLLDSALAGKGGVCLLSGDPGIGKSRLASEVVDRARTRGMVAITACCADAEGAPSYWPWLQLLRAHVARSSARELRDDLGTDAAIIVRTVPDLEPFLGRLAPASLLSAEEERFHFFDGVTRLFLRASRRRPMLLVIDDLQFADAPSLRLFEFLSRETAQAPLLLLVSHRSADTDLMAPAREALARVARHDHCRRASLRGLDRAAVKTLADASGLMSSLPSSSIDQLHARTGGNPFFVRELLRHAIESGSLSDDVPSPVRDLVTMRMSKLSAECVRVLEIASILGIEWRGQIVRGIADIHAETFLAVVQEGIDSHMIARRGAASDRFVFAHSLTRDAIYRGLSTRERAPAP